MNDYIARGFSSPIGDEGSRVQARHVLHTQDGEGVVLPVV